MSDGEPDPRSVRPPRRPGTGPMGPAAERLAHLSACVLIGATVLEGLCLVGVVFSSGSSRDWYVLPQCPLLTLALGAALTYLIVTRRGWRRRSLPRAGAAAPSLADSGCVTAFAWAVLAAWALILAMMLVGWLAFQRL